MRAAVLRKRSIWRGIGAGLAGGLVLGAASAAWAAPGAAADNCVYPDWKVKPTASQLFGVWPREAFLRHQSGSAKIHCKVSVEGALRDCAILTENPPDTGFGQAALALTPQFLMTPKRCAGVLVEGEVDIPIHFAGMGWGAPTPAPGTAPGTGSRLPGGSRTDMRDAVPRPTQTGPLVLSQVLWTAAPTYADVVAAYPAKPGGVKVGGHVALACRFGGVGQLLDCDTLSEAPKGQGFAGAARTLAKAFLGPVKLPDGSSTRDDTTTVAFTFDPAMLSGAAPVIGEPKWTHLPEAVDVAASFPTAARAAHVAVGHVTMACEVGDGGRLTGCTVTHAAPEGLGFEAAALALSANFQVTVWTDEGLPTVGGRLNVPIRYEAGSAADAHPAPSRPPTVVAPSQTSPVPAAPPQPAGRPVTFQAFTLFTHFSAGPYYPERAAGMGVTGFADLDCTLGDGGVLDACTVAAEAPAGQGFGPAAQQMARKRAIRLKDAGAAGGPKSGERVQVSVPFTLEGAR